MEDSNDILLQKLIDLDKKLQEFKDSSELVNLTNSDKINLQMKTGEFYQKVYRDINILQSEGKILKDQVIDSFNDSKKYEKEYSTLEESIKKMNTDLSDKIADIQNKMPRKFSQIIEDWGKKSSSLQSILKLVIILLLGISFLIAYVPSFSSFVGLPPNTAVIELEKKIDKRLSTFEEKIDELLKKSKTP